MGLLKTLGTRQHRVGLLLCLAALLLVAVFFYAAKHTPDGIGATSPLVSGTEQTKPGLKPGPMVWRHKTVPEDLGQRLVAYGVTSIALGGNIFDMDAPDHLDRAGFGHQEFERLDELQIHLAFGFRDSFVQFIDSGDPAAVDDVLSGIESTIHYISGTQSVPYPQIAGIQLDYEGDDLADYANLIDAVRQRFGDSYLISSWVPVRYLDQSAFTMLIEDLDFLIPMLYDFGWPQDFDLGGNFEVTDPGWIAQQIPLWENLGKPYYAGIPSYSYAVIYDALARKTATWANQITPEELSQHPNFTLLDSQLNSQTVPADPDIYSGDNIHIFHCITSTTLHAHPIVAGGRVKFDVVTPQGVKRYKNTAESNAGANFLGVALFRDIETTPNMWDTAFDDADRHVMPAVRVSQALANGLQALYVFEEGSGTTINDISGVGEPLNLSISDGAAVTWVPGGLRIDSSTILVSSGAAEKIIEAARASNELTIEAWIRPANTTQSGPARIVSLSPSPDARNFTLGQDADSYETRLRTTETSSNGLPALSAPDGAVDTQLAHVVYTREASGVARLYVDGVEQASEIVGGNFVNWDPSYHLALANEISVDRPWLGEFHLLAIYNRALGQTDVGLHFHAGPDSPMPNQPGSAARRYRFTLTNSGLEDSFLDDRATGIFIALENARFGDQSIDRGDFDDLRYYRMGLTGPVVVTSTQDAEFVELLEHHLDVNESVESGPITFVSTGSVPMVRYRGWATSLDDTLQAPGQNNPYFDPLHQRIETKIFRAPADDSVINDDYEGTTRVTDYHAYTLSLAVSDTIAPSPPGLPYVHAVQRSGSDAYLVDWTDPADDSGIAGAYYKLGGAPVSDTDGVFTIAKPISVPGEYAGQRIYLWLRDGVGNIDHQHRSRVTLSHPYTMTVIPQVSANGRYLVDQTGQPFLWLGDTAWELVRRLDQAQVDQYVENRAAKGFTVIQIPVVTPLGGWDAPNVYGELPFLNADAATPNEAYFEHVDYVIDAAQRLGIVTALFPIWGWYETRLDADAAYTYGYRLGSRYRDDSVVWVLGGDADPTGFEEVWQRLAQGLRAGDGGKHLISYHPGGERQSSVWFHNEDWLDFNTIQTGHSWDNAYYELILEDYDRIPVKPLVDGEPRYENISGIEGLGSRRITAHQVRKAAYNAMLSGALGHTYGANEVWQMYMANGQDGYVGGGGNGLFGANTLWQEAMDFEGAFQMGHLKSLFMAYPWYELVPDQSIVLSGNGWGGAYVPAARAADGSFVLIYIPEGQSITVDMAKITGQRVAALWFNPRTGVFFPVDGSSFPSSGYRDFMPPSGQGGDPDYVLVLRSPIREVTVKKIPDPKFAVIDQTVVYTYQVTNTGDFTLDTVIATDVPLGAVGLMNSTLTPWQSTRGTLTFTVNAGDPPGWLVNTVTVTGTLPSGSAVTSTSEAWVNLLTAMRMYMPVTFRE